MNTTFPSFRSAGARLAVAIVVAAAAIGMATAASSAPLAMKVAALPGDSIYQLPVVLTGQDGRSTGLDSRRGAPVLIGMFYTSCKFVCPMLIETVHDVEAKLSAEEREHVTVLLVSIDPAHDSVEVLKRFASIADPSQIVCVIVVDEGAVKIDWDKGTVEKPGGAAAAV